jgi:hypothetical protein
VVHLAQFYLRFGIAGGCRFLEPFHGSLVVFLRALPQLVHDAEVELRLGIVFFSHRRVELQRQRVIASEIGLRGGVMSVDRILCRIGRREEREDKNKNR